MTLLVGSRWLDDEEDRIHSRLSASLTPVVDILVASHVSANAVTAAALVVGMFSGIALALNWFSWAALGLFLAYLGDALDGPIARRTQTASVAGALFDASADRYQEFFALGGLAILFRASAPALALVIAGLAGAFMVSYGSAKAEGVGTSVPPGLMRRPQRAACLWTGVALVPFTSWIRTTLHLPACVEHAPVVVAIAIIAVVGNVSAIRRLRKVALDSIAKG